MTLSLSNVASTLWDVIVVGAGPAGGFAALELSRRGIQVLIVDKARFPRAKVCGCCLNGVALSILEEAGLGDTVINAGAVPLSQVHLQAGNVSARLKLPNGAALSREILDEIIIEQAQKHGAVFLAETEARFEQTGSAELCSVILQQQQEQMRVQGRILLVADGLQGGTLREESAFVSRPASNARVGAGLTIRESTDFFQPGHIYLAFGRGGYVGVVGLEHGEWNLASALDRDWLREKGSVGQAVQALFTEVGWPTFRDAGVSSWRGTPPLTRNVSSVAGKRWFVIGDASGYVEPFTGEGMAWALLSARAITPVVMQSLHHWTDDHAHEWIQRRKRLLEPRQRWCRRLARLLRSPLLLREGIRILSWMPALAQPVLRRMNRCPGMPQHP